MQKTDFTRAVKDGVLFGSVATAVIGSYAILKSTLAGKSQQAVLNTITDEMNSDLIPVLFANFIIDTPDKHPSGKAVTNWQKAGSFAAITLGGIAASEMWRTLFPRKKETPLTLSAAAQAAQSDKTWVETAATASTETAHCR